MYGEIYGLLQEDGEVRRMITVIGIGMRCLELAGNLLVFGLIFGYPLAEKRRWVAAGLVGMLAIMFPVMLPNESFTLSVTTLLLYAVIFLFFEKMQVGLVLVFYLAKSSLRNFCMGILTVMVAFPVRTIEGWHKASLTNNCILLLIILTASLLLYRHKQGIYEKIKQVPVKWYLFMCLFLYLPTYTYWTSSTLEQDVLRMEGILTVVDGLIGIMFAVFFVLMVLLYFKGRELKQQIEINHRCIAMQTEQYRLLNDKQVEMKKFRHDSNAHLRAIYALAEDADSEHIQRYVSRLIEQEEELRHFDTGSIIGDAVINQYYAFGLKDEVEVKLVGTLAEDFTVPETEFCVILTNAVSNAYEAAQRCIEQKFIEIIFTHYRETQFITVRNSSPDCPGIMEGRIPPGYTSKSEAEQHGFGVQSICDAVEWNGGSVRWRSEPSGTHYLVTVEIQVPIKGQH